MGYLLALSGLDGSGKTTQAEHISSILKGYGLKVEVLHFKNVESKKYLPNIKRRLEQYIVDHHIEDKKEVHQICCSFLFNEKIIDKVLPSLELNNFIILDRYRDSALCYHYLLDDRIYPHVQTIYDEMICPDLNFFLDLSPDECYKRVKPRENLSPFETPEYLRQAYDYYQSTRDKFIWIKGTQSIDDISRTILEEIEIMTQRNGSVIYTDT